MKKLIFTAVLLSSFNAFAQNTFPTTGSVGIGTSSPLVSLDVHGNQLVGGANLDGASLSYLTNSARLLIGWNRSPGAGETDFIANQGLGASGGFAFYNHDNNNNEQELLWIQGATGDVCIGTNDPKGYKLAVAGSVVATSVTVKLQANWPDYVFSPNYNLPKLSAIKTYIELNHHLPDIPAANQIATGGINLGDMDKLLTKKIEELTLYLIQKEEQRALEQEQINQQKEQLKSQQKQIDSLRKELEIIIKKQS